MAVVSLSLVFWCYQQVHDVVNMSCLGVILQLRGCDGMFTPQNGAAVRLHTDSLAYHVFAMVVSVAFPAVFIFLSVLLW